jgi:hypothetical protein
VGMKDTVPMRVESGMKMRSASGEEKRGSRTGIDRGREGETVEC